MSEAISFNVETRKGIGTGHARRLRRQDDKVPGVVYGGNKPTVYFSIDYRHIAKAIQAEAFYSQVLELVIQKKKERVVLRELQRHPASDRVLHIDFLRISEDRAINIAVPIHYLNEDKCHGVRLQSGVISKNLTEVEVSCLPKHLPEFIPIDLEHVELGTTIHLSDLELPEGVSIVALTHGAEHDVLVVSVHLPRGGAVEDEEAEEDVAEEDSDEEDESTPDEDET